MKFTVIGLALVSALMLAAPSLGGAGGAPIVASPLAVGKMTATTIHATTGSMILESIKIAPGGSFGWHTHGAAVAVVVTGGTLTVFDPWSGAASRSRCRRASRSSSPRITCISRATTARPR
jgi:hypothetical protein